MIRHYEFKFDSKKKFLAIILSFLTSLILMSYTTSIYAIEDIDYFPIEVKKVEIFGESMTSKILFSPGDQVVLKISVEKPLHYFLTSEMAGTTDYKLIISVMDMSRTPTFIDVIDSSIEVGETWEISTSFSLSTEATIGKYLIQALVWDNEGIPLAKTIGEVNFYVA